MNKKELELKRKKHRETVQLRRDKYPYENSWISINSQRKKKGKKPICKNDYIKYWNFMNQFYESKTVSKQGKPQISVEFFLKLVRRKKIVLS